MYNQGAHAQGGVYRAARRGAPAVAASQVDDGGGRAAVARLGSELRGEEQLVGAHDVGREALGRVALQQVVVLLEQLR